ncbi:MAG: AIR synthase [Crenarchaeota archaeon]|nr:AIR synthase [Thermoproteota archaeon]
MISVLTAVIELRKGMGIDSSLKLAKGIFKDTINIMSNAGKWAPRRLGVRAGEGGLGSRGLGDWEVHEALSSLSGGGDAGSVGDLVMAVDGFHSRLSAVPLLMGFHATRAAIRDVMVSGALPLATLIDVHVADDTDVAYVLDVTAGAYVASEASGAELVGGSTLRIGGDAVLGERVTGGSFAVGKRIRKWSRFNVEPGNVLYATLGKGGGTVTAYALTHSRPELVELTINVDFVGEIKKAVNFDCVRGAFDWTNGGILLDAFEISEKVGVKVVLEDSVYEAVHPTLLKAFEEDGIDPLRTSTDSIVFVAEEGCELPFVRVGRIEKGRGVYLEGKPLSPSFREAPYTHSKKAVEGLEKRLSSVEALRYMRERIAALREVLGLGGLRRAEVDPTEGEEGEGGKGNEQA